jgi:hypothetical protein
MVSTEQTTFSTLAILFMAARSYTSWRQWHFSTIRGTDLIIERKLNIVLPFCYPTR